MPPVVAGRATGRTTGGPTTSHPATLPASIQAGVDRLIVAYSVDSGPTMTADTASQNRGWVKLAAHEPGSVVGSVVFQKLASGDDALTVTSSFSEESTHISYRIPNGGVPLVATPTIAATANGNPPSYTPAGGAVDRLWLAILATEAQNVATAAPASYSNFTSITAETATGASIASAERELATASEDPGAFTSPAEDHVAWTIAVPYSPSSFFTRFTEYSLGATPSDWLNTFGSGSGFSSYTIAAEADGERYMRVQKASSGIDGLIWDAVPAATDADVYVEFESSSASNLAGRFKAGARMDAAAGTGYFAGHGQTLRARIVEYTPASGTVIESTGTANYPAGTRIRVRFRVSSSTVQVKVWTFGEYEPASWTLSTTDPSLTAAGKVGLFTFGSASAATDIKVYAVGVGINGANAPRTHYSSPIYSQAVAASIAHPFPAGTVVTHLASGEFDALRDGGTRTHRGRDLHVAYGTPVYAMTAGVIHTFMPGSDGVITPGSGLGYGLQINTKKIRYTYGHFGPNQINKQAEAFAPGISPGVTVTQGQLLGWAGESGAADSGPHLHVDWRDLAGDVTDDPTGNYTVTLGSEDAPRFNPKASLDAAEQTATGGLPTVSAGADVASHTAGTAFSRTATESTNTAASITSRAWAIFSGPAGVGTTIGNAALLSWTPFVAGTYVLRYSATNPSGTDTDDVQVVVVAAPSAYPTTVQEKIGSVLPAGTSGTIVLDTPATAQNLLVLFVAGDKNTGTLTVTDDTTDPDPWTVEVSLVSTSVSLYVAYREAEGGEDTITASFTAAAAAGSTAWLVELAQSGSGAWSVVGKATTITNEASVSSSSTGTTPALTYNGISFSVMAADTCNNVTGGTWTNSYVNRYDAPQSGVGGNSGTGSLHVGSRTVDAGQTTSSTWTNAVGSTADQQSAAVVAFGRAQAAPGTLTQAWLGVDALVVKTSGSGTARVAFSTSSGMTFPTYSGALQTPDANGISRHAVPASLSADTPYWYQVELNGTFIGSPQQFRTLPASTGVQSFSFGFSSCREEDTDEPSRNPSAFSDAITRGVDFFLQTGDFHYDDISTNDQALFRASYDEFHTQSNISTLLKSIPTCYTWSDHDGMPDRLSAAKPAAQAIYRERVPHPTLPSATGGIYHTFRIGRVRFIVLDTRSYCDPVGTAEGSSKTKIGSEQKTWLQGLLAAADTPLTVIVSAEPWIGGTTGATNTGQDHWGFYSTERSEIGAFISVAPTKVIFLCGDAHMLAYDDGTNAVANTPVYHAGALNQGASIKGGPYSGGTRGSTNAYGFVNVVDTGSKIDFTYSGYYDGGTLWSAHTTTVLTADNGAFFSFFM